MIKLGTDEHDTEDKSYWVEEYTKKETQFCKIMTFIGIPTEINPEKEFNKYAPDILVNRRLADLKYTSTPFYTAYKNYNLNPRYAVTFNDKDYNRYKANYPDIILYFWLDFMDSKGHKYGVNIDIDKCSHIFEVPFKQVMNDIESDKVQYHNYLRRENDIKGNAKGSYLLDVRTMNKIFTLEGI
jgi:hypothetical protein